MDIMEATVLSNVQLDVLIVSKKQGSVEHAKAACGGTIVPCYAHKTVLITYAHCLMVLVSMDVWMGSMAQHVISLVLAV